MSANAKDTGPVLSDMEDADLPDFSGDEWAGKIDAAPVKQDVSESGGAEGIDDNPAGLA